ncbi:MAG: hypothetical protein GY834_03340 [Bacteroidetes bacterium]|nr:hypothetical protein [Bacteroidota bacterium]
MERIFQKLNRYFDSKWHLSVLDMDRGRWKVKPERSIIAYLKAENANGRHILIQPDIAIEPDYLVADDVSWGLIYRQHQYFCGKWKPGRMVVETSANNYQVWIRSSRPLSIFEKQYWLKRLHSDPGAAPKDRWGRCPGFRNRKHKYRTITGGYPLSKLIWVDWKQPAIIPKKNNINLKTKKVEKTLLLELKNRYPSKEITRSNYERNDESATDFAYAIALFRKGHSSEEVYRRIISERSNWTNHTGDKRLSSYMNRTINRAKQIVDKT